MKSHASLIDVRRALESETLVPCFQPIVELNTGRLAGFEVLARWPHPDLGLILPKNFISLAEENGLIGELTHQVLSKSFLSAAMLPGPLFLTVNISPTQLRYLTLPRQIHDVAEDSGFPLQRLILEITEGALVNNLESSRKIAFGLKEMGCRLALDDFGTGYSSLMHLQALPFSMLKVDRIFVESMTSERESRMIVAAVVGLGNSLGMTTVAEGVETEEQADILRWLGCDFAQGWLYGRPLPAQHIPEMVAAAPGTLSARILGETNKFMSALEALPAQRLAQLQAIYDGVPVGLCFLDRNLRYVSLNQRLADLNDVPVVAHIGKTVQEVIPNLFPRIEEFLQRALRGEAFSDVEVFRPSTKPGEPDRTFHLSYQPAFDEAHEVVGISVAIVDITQRTLGEELLRVTNENLRRIVEVRREIPWTLNSDGNLLEISSRWVQLTGLTLEQSFNLGWLEALHPDDVGPTLNALRNARNSGKPIDIVLRVKTVDGEWKWLRARGAPQHGPSGEVVQWLGGCENIAERQEQEEALGDDS